MTPPRNADRPAAGPPGLRLYMTTVTAARLLSWLAVLVLLAASLAISLDVTLRFLFASPIHGLEDIVALIVTIAVAACFPAAFALRTNITVRMLGKALGPAAAMRLELFGQTVGFVFILLVAWQLVVHVGDMAGRVTFILGLPVQWAWQVAAGLAIIAAAVQAVVVFVHLTAAVTGRPLPAAAALHGE